MLTKSTWPACLTIITAQDCCLLWFFLLPESYFLNIEMLSEPKYIIPRFPKKFKMVYTGKKYYSRMASQKIITKRITSLAIQNGVFKPMKEITGFCRSTISNSWQRPHLRTTSPAWRALAGSLFDLKEKAHKIISSVV